MLFYYNFRVIFYARYSIAREKPCATRDMAPAKNRLKRYVIVFSGNVGGEI